MNQSAADYFERSPAKEITTDFNHGSSELHASAEQGKSSGWLRKIINRDGHGLFAVWKATKLAADYVAKEEYRYFSPSLEFNEIDKYTGKRIPMRITAGGLTNRPFFEGMQPLEFSDIPADGPMQLYAADDLKDFDDTINHETKGDKMETLIKRLKAAGILAADFSDTASEEEVADAVEAKEKDDAKKLKDAEDAKKAAEEKAEGKSDPDAKPAEGDTGKLQERIDATDTQLDKVTKDFSDYRERTESKERKEILAQAVKDGKIAADKATTDYWDDRLKADFADTSKHIQKTMRKGQYIKTDGPSGSNAAENMPASYMDACDLVRAEWVKAGKKAGTDFSENDVIEEVEKKFPTLYETEFTDQT